MNKFVIAALFVLSAGSAFATDIPTPPRRPANLGTPTTTPPAVGAVVKDGMVIVRAPVGSGMNVDVDGTDIDVSISEQKNTLLPWNWSIWK